MKTEFGWNMEGVRCIEATRAHRDGRGTFEEIYKDIDIMSMKQCNISHSRKYVLRGLHIQLNKPQGKFIYVLRGTLLDMWVDLRPNSSTYKKADCVWLGPGDKLFLPPGLAHGFFADTRTAIIYFCSELYNGASDGGILWSDPALPFSALLKYNKKFIMSDKDKNLPTRDQWTDKNALALDHILFCSK